MLSGVYKPQEGRVTFLGEDILGRRPHQNAARGHGPHVPEHRAVREPDGDRQPHARPGARREVRDAGRLVLAGPARSSELADRAAVEDIVDFLELAQYRGFPVGLLPYGVQKRVELGRALAMQPKLLLLDEPVAGMNLEETEDMARFILDIRDELKIPMIMVEHDMGLVMDLADRVMVVDFGVPITTGVPAEVQKNPDVIKAYLGEDHATGGRRSKGSTADGSRARGTRRPAAGSES